MMACACSVVIARESEAMLVLDLDDEQLTDSIRSALDFNSMLLVDFKPAPEPFLASILMLIVAIDGDQESLILDQIGEGLVFDVAGLQDDRAG